MLTENFWIQLVGFFGVLLLLLMFQINDRKRMLRIQSMSHLMMAVHFLLLGALTGAVVSLIRIWRNHELENKRRRKWQLAFWLVLFVIVGVVTWRDWTSILPVLATVFGTIALWQNNPHSIRLWSLLVPPCWFLYSAFNGSYAGMVGYAIVFASVLIGLWRFDSAKHGKLKPEHIRARHYS